MADGCGGQNKNTTMVGMLCSWFETNAPLNISSVELIFPMVGHSFLPSDRVFARIEKDIRKHEVIALPQDYVDIFSQHGTPIALHNKVYDWKSACQNIIKQPGSWHFQFNATKYFFLTKKTSDILVRGEPNYRAHYGKAQSIFRKNCKASHIRTKLIPPEKVDVNPLKLRDVSSLLTKHFGVKWVDNPNLTFYKLALQLQVDGVESSPAAENCTNRDTDSPSTFV